MSVGAGVRSPAEETAKREMLARLPLPLPLADVASAKAADGAVVIGKRKFHTVMFFGKVLRSKYSKATREARYTLIDPGVERPDEFDVEDGEGPESVTVVYNRGLSSSPDEPNVYDVEDVVMVAGRLRFSNGLPAVLAYVVREPVDCGEYEAHVLEAKLARSFHTKQSLRPPPLPKDQLVSPSLLCSADLPAAPSVMAGVRVPGEEEEEKEEPAEKRARCDKEEEEKPEEQMVVQESGRRGSAGSVASSSSSMAANPPTSIYERFNLYTLTDKFYVEPRDRDGGSASDTYVEIDRHTNAIRLCNTSEARIPIAGAEIELIHGVMGAIQLVSGMALVVIKRAQLIGQLNGHDIWRAEHTQIVPYKKTTLHLTEKQNWYNRYFSEMVEQVVSQPGFYFSRTLDLSHTHQWLAHNATPEFHAKSMLERANTPFVWNNYLLQPFAAVQGTGRFCLPVIHGFVGRVLSRVGGQNFSLWLVSRRSVLRAGVRFYKRGVDAEGHPANYVETEQIVEMDKQGDRFITSFVQMRGSIPLFWSQKPNLKWQPMPTMKAADDQLRAYVKHFTRQKDAYGGQHVIVNLVNQKGREKRVGGELQRISVQANLPYVRHHPFDFHKECHAMKWHRLTILRDQLRDELEKFGFFSSSLQHSSVSRSQTGYYRTNCMDCLDRTNVVQAMLARESLRAQLLLLGVLQQGELVEDLVDLEPAFKNLWADNGDECSRQYAGTGALKADFTRLGKRTYAGAMNDGVNAITRYFRNNFADGYRQDALDLFLGNFVVDPCQLPARLETTILALDYHGVALVAASFAAAMVVLCLIVAENVSATIFWLAVLFFCMAFIFLNGEEFVNVPKLKQD